MRYYYYSSSFNTCNVEIRGKIDSNNMFKFLFIASQVGIFYKFRSDKVKNRNTFDCKTEKTSVKIQKNQCITSSKVHNFKYATKPF